MTKSEIMRNLSESCPWQDSVLWFDSIDSTNTQARELAAQGAPEGTVLIADRQTCGRGSRGRSFHSPGGTGIYLSVILRPNCPPTKLMHLTCGAAVAVCEAIQAAAGIQPGIKWTNDLVLDGRKIAGILTELSVTPKGIVDFVIVGIGINCLQSREDFPEGIAAFAGSLKSVTGKEIDRSRLAAELIRSLYRMAQELLPRKDAILARYRKNCITLGREISIVKADGIVTHARALDIDKNGGLIVRLQDGTVTTVSSGEVSIRGMYGYL